MGRDSGMSPFVPSHSCSISISIFELSEGLDPTPRFSSDRYIGGKVLPKYLTKRNEAHVEYVEAVLN